MKNAKNFLKRLVCEEEAQGLTEYILLLVAVVGILMAFKTQIKAQMDGAIGSLGETISRALQ